ncbi:hypothetical protein KC614_05190, partial [candidate division WWE3 bacterium]|nr:hypothetical protein [candidate division WWE3 bacterium]
SPAILDRLFVVTVIVGVFGMVVSTAIMAVTSTQEQVQPSLTFREASTQGKQSSRSHRFMYAGMRTDVSLTMPGGQGVLGLFTRRLQNE